jgi:hypothetical protein
VNFNPVFAGMAFAGAEGWLKLVLFQEEFYNGKG